MRAMSKRCEENINNHRKHIVDLGSYIRYRDRTITVTIHDGHGQVTII